MAEVEEKNLISSFETKFTKIYAEDYVKSGFSFLKINNEISQVKDLSELKDYLSSTSFNYRPLMEHYIRDTFEGLEVET